ncbi:MAG: NAD(P)-dependent glycerol-3-phosphate dehydrogenase [Gammaproteobacteria bacterium]|nr:NAD(P)-dependent glycerol-3-phosphate dehydrogenase [Gammaproteobacteria bacterium]
MTNAESIAVLGAGSWGTALAVLVAENDFSVRLWGRDPERMKLLQQERSNREYLPGVEFPDNLSIEADLTRLAQICDDFLVVVPSHSFRRVLEDLAAGRDAGQRASTVAWGTKGFDPQSSALLSDVVEQIFKRTAARAIISGPTFATEVARRLPAALTVAGDDLQVAERVATWLRNDRVRVYISDDLAGVQLGGAIKNVMALAAGISDGLGFGANARAGLITRGLAEMNRLGVVLGGKPHTFMGLTGIGDLILTCTDDQSRNRRVGLGLGRGQPLSEVLQEVGQEAEGVNTVRELYRLAKRLNVEMPITEQVYRVVCEGYSPLQAVADLLGREPKPE